MSPVVEKLGALRFAPLRVSITTLEPFRVPEYKGALFRGGFGHFFRDLVCRTRADCCEGCAETNECSYALVFENPVPADKLPVLRKYPYAPHPFVLAPPLDGRTYIPAGERLDLNLTLVGPAMEYLPLFIYVLEAMGRSGRYGGRFRVVEVTSALWACGVVYDGASRRIVAPPPIWEVPRENVPVSGMRLEFVTPLRMRTGGRYNARPDFVAVAQALLRRIHLLAALYGDGDGDAGWMRPLLAQADGVATARSEFWMYRWDRMSGRQRRRVEMDGVLGWLEARGELRELGACFRAGEWLQVGSGTSLGMGRYKCGFSTVV